MKVGALTRAAIVAVVVGIPGATLGTFLEIPKIITFVLLNLIAMWIMNYTDFLRDIRKVGNKEVNQDG